MPRSGIAIVVLTFSLGSPAAGAPLYGGIGFEIFRELGGVSEQPPGAVVTVDLAGLGSPDVPSGDSKNPGGTTLVADVFDTPDDGYLLGIEFDSTGHLFASTFECADPSLCFEGPSRLLEIDPVTGDSTEIGFITDGTDNLSIYDLAFGPEPGTDALYGISTFLGDTCFSCLYTIDTETAVATLVGEVDIGEGSSGGLAFGPGGTLYMTTVSPSSGVRFAPMDLLVLNPATGAVASREEVLLEQQLIVIGGGVEFLITTVPLAGLVVAPDGTLLGTGDNGITVLYERVRGTVMDPDGSQIGGETWVWRGLGDSGEVITDLAFIPEPASLALLAVGLVGLATLARRQRRAVAVRSSLGAPLAPARSPQPED